MAADVTAANQTTQIGLATGPTTGTVTSLSQSTSSAQALASSSSRKGACFFNNSNARIYLKFGTTASNSSYTVDLLGGARYYLPICQGGVYTGRIDAIWQSAGSGTLQITSLA